MMRLLYVLLALIAFAPIANATWSEVYIGVDQNVDHGNAYVNQQKLVRNSDDSLFYVYPREVSGITHIYIARSADEGETWTTLGYIDTCGATPQQWPAIAIDGNDILYVVWVGPDSLEDEPQIKFNKSTDDGNTWANGYTNIAYIEDYDQRAHTQESGGPSIAVYRNHIWVAWSGKDEVNQDEAQIKTVYSANSGTSWFSWEQAGDDYGYRQYRPHLMLVGSRPHMVWWGYSEDYPSNAQTKYAYMTGTGQSFPPWTGWSDPVVIDPDGGSYRKVNSWLMKDSNDKFWLFAKGDPYDQIYLSTSTDGGSNWTEWSDFSGWGNPV